MIIKSISITVFNKYINDYKISLSILDDIKKCNLKLNTQTFNILIYGMTKLNKIELIDELLKR